MTDIRTRQLKLSVSPKFTKADAELLVWGAYLAALLGVVVGAFQ